MLTPPEIFTVPLEYSAEERRLEYQGALAGQEVAKLHYIPPAGTDRGDYALMPGIMKHYRIEALIDRMAFVWVTHGYHAWKDIRTLLKSDLGDSCYVEAINPEKGTHQISWPQISDLLKQLEAEPSEVGRFFTIMVQTPDPDRLRRGFEKLQHRFRMDPEVPPGIVILEVALDFHPRSSSPQERLALSPHSPGNSLISLSWH